MRPAKNYGLIAYEGYHFASTMADVESYTPFTRLSETEQEKWWQVARAVLTACPEVTSDFKKEKSSGKI